MPPKVGDEYEIDGVRYRVTDIREEPQEDGSLITVVTCERVDGV